MFLRVVARLPPARLKFSGAEGHERKIICRSNQTIRAMVSSSVSPTSLPSESFRANLFLEVFPGD
jgi:hypothetical protein